MNTLTIVLLLLLLVVSVYFVYKLLTNKNNTADNDPPPPGTIKSLDPVNSSAYLGAEIGDLDVYDCIDKADLKCGVSHFSADEYVPLRRFSIIDFKNDQNIVDSVSQYFIDKYTESPIYVNDTFTDYQEMKDKGAAENKRYVAISNDYTS